MSGRSSNTFFFFFFQSLSEQGLLEVLRLGMDTVEVRLRLNVKQLTWNLIVVCDCEGGELLKKNKITKEGVRVEMEI